MLDTEHKRSLRTSNDDGDHERFSHYVKRTFNEGANARIMRAMVEGTPIEAICGKVWIPSKNPERFPICPKCKEIKENNSHP